MKARVHVTFEFDERAPETRTVALEATAPGTIAARAIRQVQKEVKPRGWSSLVVLLERMDPLVRGVSEGASTGDELLDAE